MDTDTTTRTPTIRRLAAILACVATGVFLPGLVSLLFGEQIPGPSILSWSINGNNTGCYGSFQGIASNWLPAALPLRRSLPWDRLDKQWLSNDEVCRLQVLETAAHVYDVRHLYGIGIPVVPDHLCGGYLLEADGTGVVDACESSLYISTFGVSTDGTRESLLYDRRGYVSDRADSFVIRRDW